MSDSGNIKNLEDFSTDMKNSFFLNQEFSDVILIVDGTRFECNKALLASRSSYFKTLLFGEFKEKNESEIQLQNVDPCAFRAILQYLFSGQVNLSTMEFNIVLDVLRTCHEWQLSGFLKSVSKYIESNINLNNFCSILNHAVFLELNEMLTKCGTFCGKNAAEILKSPIFKELSTKSFCEILKRESVYEHKEDLFNIIHQWVKKDTAKGSIILPKVRFDLFEPIFLLKTVKDSGLISTDIICEAVLLNLQNKKLSTFKEMLEERNKIKDLLNNLERSEWYKKRSIGNRSSGSNLSNGTSLQAQLGNIQKRCYDELVIFCKEKAAERNVGFSTILSVPAMRAMSIELPETVNQICQLPGITKLKCSEYEEEFLAITRKYSAEKFLLLHNDSPSTKKFKGTIIEFSSSDESDEDEDD